MHQIVVSKYSCHFHSICVSGQDLDVRQLLPSWSHLAVSKISLASMKTIRHSQTSSEKKLNKRCTNYTESSNSLKAIKYEQNYEPHILKTIPSDKCQFLKKIKDYKRRQQAPSKSAFIKCLLSKFEICTKYFL